MGWCLALLLALKPQAQERELNLRRDPEPPDVRAHWAPLRSFDVAAHAFFGDGAAPAPAGQDGPLTPHGVGAKLRVWDADAQRFDLSLAAFAKIPFGRDHPTRQEELPDIAFAGLARVPVGPSSFHAHLGATLPFSEEPDVPLASFAFAGAGFTWDVADDVALGVQLEVNTCAFRDVDLLRRHPASAVFGLRAVRGPRVFEAGLGTGFDRRSGYPWMAYLSLGIDF